MKKCGKKITPDNIEELGFMEWDEDIWLYRSEKIYGKYYFNKDGGYIDFEGPKGIINWTFSELSYYDLRTILRLLGDDE